MKDKKHLLFDADNTLYDFQATEKAALGRLFGEYGISWSLVDIYHEGNRRCWRMFEEGAMTIEELEPARFRMFFEAIGIAEDPIEAGRLYSKYLGEEGIMLPGAIELLEKLYGRYSLSIVTNGIADVQRERIRRSDTGRFFDNVFISQEIGFSKPDPRFFSFVLNALGAEKESCLVIGDSLTSDIKGARDSGIDSVYISFSGDSTDEATYCVSSYDGLMKLLG